MYFQLTSFAAACASCRFSVVSKHSPNISCAVVACYELVMVMNLSENGDSCGEQVDWNEYVSSIASASGGVVQFRVRTIATLVVSAYQHEFQGRTHFVLVE